jgi:Flp pilus assembly protein TadD
VRRIARVVVPVLAALFAAGCGSMEKNRGDDLLKMQRDAQVAFDNGENARAEKIYQALTRATPNDAEAWLRLGNLYARTDHPDQAVDAYLKCLALNSADPRAWQNLGVVRMRQAWAALIRANTAAGAQDPIRAMSGEMLKALEQMPYISDADAAKRPPAQP